VSSAGPAPIGKAVEKPPRAQAAIRCERDELDDAVGPVEQSPLRAGQGNRLFACRILAEKFDASCRRTTEYDPGGTITWPSNASISTSSVIVASNGLGMTEIYGECLSIGKPAQGPRHCPLYGAAVADGVAWT
jgi:hypothetical protein